MWMLTKVIQWTWKPLWWIPFSQCWQRQTLWRCQLKQVGELLKPRQLHRSSQVSIQSCPCCGPRQTWEQWCWQEPGSQQLSTSRPRKRLSQLFVLKASCFFGRSFQSCRLSFITCSSSWKPEERFGMKFWTLKLTVWVYQNIVQCLP